MKQTIKKQYPVIGMSCASCAANIEHQINKIQGIVCASVNLANQLVTIEFEPSVVKPEELKELLVSTGYDLIIDESSDAMKDAEDKKYQRLKTLRRRTFIAVFMAVPLVVIGMFFMDMPFANYIMWALATPIVFWLGRDFFINGWKRLLHKSATMDTLVALSCGIAYLFSVFNTLVPSFWTNKGLHAHVYFEAAGVIITLVFSISLQN